MKELGRRFGAEEWLSVVNTIGTTEEVGRMAVHQAKLEELMGKLVTDAGAALGRQLAYLGDTLGILIEPFANHRLEDNLNSVGRVFYGASAMICTPSSLSENGPGLGAQAGEARTRTLFDAAGFAPFRRATETPFPIVYEARA